MRIDVAAGRCAEALTCGAELLVTLSDRDWVASTPAPLSETYRNAVTLTLAEAACSLDSQTVLAALRTVSAGDHSRDPMAVTAATLWPQVEALRLRGESVAWLRRAADFLMLAPRGQLRSSVMTHLATFGTALELPGSRDLLSLHPRLGDRVKAC